MEVQKNNILVENEMSFGFSVGDILPVSQLAYRLYSALSGCRRSAGKEFENAVFGLRCALDHLSRQADDITATAAHMAVKRWQICERISRS